MLHLCLLFANGHSSIKLQSRGKLIIVPKSYLEHCIILRISIIHYTGLFTFCYVGPRQPEYTPALQKDNEHFALDPCT